MNDFKRREFRAEDISLFSLLTIYAGLTIERVKAIEETRLLSITDGLTGLSNQRYLMEQLQKELQRAARHKNPLAVIMFDIDNFKAYNDSYGHLEGNKVLKTIARMLRKSTRLSDTVGRFGGEEFCLVMPEISKEGAKAFASRIVKENGRTPHAQQEGYLKRRGLHVPARRKNPRASFKEGGREALRGQEARQEQARRGVKERSVSFSRINPSPSH